jgi:hypothetical protein
MPGCSGGKGGGAPHPCLAGDGPDGDEVVAAELARAARRFARHDPAAGSYLMEMARVLRIEALHRGAHAHLETPLGA